MPDAPPPPDPFAPSRHDTRFTRLLRRLNRARDRWRDASLSLLLAVQGITIFGVVPVAASGVPVPPSLIALILLMFMSLTIVMATGRWTLIVGIGTFLLTGVGVVGRAIDPTGSIVVDAAANAVALSTFGVLSLVVGLTVFRPGPFTGHRIRGAVVLYFNLGLLFGFIHRIVAELMPGAYTHLPDPHREAAFRAACDYLSFVTLTSVGYGDIVPVAPIARSLCMLEAALGQLLPTVLIGRAVILAMREGE